MAYVLCDMDALKNFQQAVDATVLDLQKELGSRDYLIEDTIRRIRIAIDRAVQREKQADQELDQAEDRLREAERRTAELNRNREPDSEPYETPSFYYEDVSECRDRYEYAVLTRKLAENTLDEFTAYSRQYKQNQEDGVEAYRNLAEKSGAFVEGYTALLMKAKEATNFGMGAEGSGASVSAGGVENTSTMADCIAQLRAEGEWVAPGSLHISPDMKPWQQAELRALNEKGGFEQVSFLDGKIVPFGTQGATRPDVVRVIGAHIEAVEVKHYDLAKAANCNILCKELVREVTDRNAHLPKGSTQRIILDVTGRGFDAAVVHKAVVLIRDVLSLIYPEIPIDIVGLL